MKDLFKHIKYVVEDKNGIAIGFHSTRKKAKEQVSYISAMYHFLTPLKIIKNKPPKE